MKKIALVSLLLIFTVTACRMSYSFKGATSLTDEYKTIDIRDFLIQTPNVYAPMGQVLNERIKDVYAQNTKLQRTNINPNLELEGEVVRYDFAPQSVKQDAYASETRMTMAVKIRFKDNINPKKDKETTISAYRDFDSSRMLTEVQDQLIEELVKEIVDQIFNTTMMDW